MNPEHRGMISAGEVLSFDSNFESGNLDRVVMLSPNEYDLYMRPDTNSQGHHQWFYFKAVSKRPLGQVKFNILNFTKSRSLYEQGMKVCICNIAEKESILESQRGRGLKPLQTEMVGWTRGGDNIRYGPSKLNSMIPKNLPRLRFYQLSFTHNFEAEDEDETYFAYSFPYTFTRLSSLLHELKQRKEIKSFYKDATPLCSSLSGVEVPYLIVTSRAHQETFDMIDPEEHEPDSVPVSKKKKTIFLTGRVHPGETNSSFMMEGFIKLITSKSNQVAIELRKRIVFKIVPFTNPDGVIVGNYRVSMSGNDLNRRYQKPHP